MAEDPQVIQQAKVMVQQYMQNPNSLDGTMVRPVLEVAARHGDAQLYDQYKAQLQKASRRNSTIATSTRCRSSSNLI